MTVSDIVKLADISRKDIAKMVGVTPETLARWMKEPYKVPVGKVWEIMMVCANYGVKFEFMEVLLSCETKNNNELSDMSRSLKSLLGDNVEEWKEDD